MNYKQKLGYTTLGAAMVLIVIGGGWALTQKWKRTAPVPVMRTSATVESPESDAGEDSCPCDGRCQASRCISPRIRSCVSKTPLS